MTARWIMVAGCALGASTAGAEPMGEAGQMIISGSVSVSYTHVSVPAGQSAVDSTKEIYIGPGLQYFVIPNVSIGGSFYIDRAWGYYTNNRVGIGPRAGYTLHLAPTLTWYPQLGLFYSHASYPTDPVSAADQLSLDLFAPVLFHPAAHVFIGFGPDLSTDLVSRQTMAGASQSADKVTELGMYSTIGAYF